MSTTEELLERKSSGSGLESRGYGCKDPSRWPHGTLYSQKLALTSPTSGGRSVGVRSRTQATDFFCVKYKVYNNYWFLLVTFYERRSERNASYFIMLAYDIGGCWWYSSMPIVCKFCCRATDSSREAVWQNGIWHESAYKAEVCHWIPSCGKNCICWHSSTLAERLWRPSSGWEHSEAMGGAFQQWLQWRERLATFRVALHIYQLSWISWNPDKLSTLTATSRRWLSWRIRRQPFCCNTITVGLIPVRNHGARYKVCLECPTAPTI
jgi:hypothetical protein